jgi:hypothetical protein
MTARRRLRLRSSSAAVEWGRGVLLILFLIALFGCFGWRACTPGKQTLNARF